MRRFLPLLAGLLVLPARLAAAEPVDYLRDVKPVLKERCYACHGALKQQAKLRLDAAALIRKGGRHGPAVVSGNSARSLLIERVTDPEEVTRMPPEGRPLSEKQIALLKAWIDRGAPAPADEKPEEDPLRHWAFRKPVRPPVPTQARGRNPIDAFLAAGHARYNLTPSPAADRPTLLRRVYLALIGLPPTREELHAFLADPAPDAYEKVVDRLLASPRYGERWARHWMDVWRYSDWYGRRAVPDVMNSYAMIWRWRDWIVRSLNEDKGYDRMVLEMLAADEIAPEDEDSLAATGFLVRNWFKWNYNLWMRDNVEHTGKAFLGLTLNCCHCHDHKYDPLSQQEYFRFRAFFEPLELRHDRVAGEPDPGPFKKYVYGQVYGPITSGRIRVFDEKLDAQTFFYTGGDERNRAPGKPPVPPGAPAALGGDRLKIEPVPLPPRAWYPGLKPFVRQEETARRRAAVTSAEAALAPARKALADAERLLAEAREAAAVKRVPPAAADVLAKRTLAAEGARLAVRLAEARLALARSDLAWVLARVAADQVVHLGDPGDAREASRAASRAERQYHLDAALLAQVQAENALAVARRNAAPAPRQALEKQLAAATAAVAACRKSLAGDSTAYTPLTPVYPPHQHGPADGPGALDRRHGQPADRPGRRQPPLGLALRPAAGGDDLQLRPQRPAAQPPGIARLLGRRADGQRLAHEGPAPPDRHERRLPHALAPGRPGRAEPQGRPGQPAAVALPRGADGGGGRARQPATRRGRTGCDDGRAGGPARARADVAAAQPVLCPPRREPDGVPGAVRRGQPLRGLPAYDLGAAAAGPGPE
jgi:hypothetical protein